MGENEQSLVEVSSGGGRELSGMPGDRRSPGGLMHPLRRVTQVDVSEEMGGDLGTHYFWMSRRYTMTLECGHQQARIGCNFHHLAPGDFMPKQVRCGQCPPKKVKSKHKPKQSPKYDEIAAALAASLIRLDPEREDGLLTWIATFGHRIEDPATRDYVHGSVALRFLDAVTEKTPVIHAAHMRAALTTWMHTPSAETKDALRKAIRRLYSAQHQNDATPGGWFAARSLIAVGRITGRAPANAKGILDAVTWDKDSRAPFYDRLWSTRRALDVSRMRVLAHLPDADDGDCRRAVLDEQEAGEALETIWEGEMPELGRHHIGILLLLLDVFATARLDKEHQLSVNGATVPARP